MSYLKSSLYYLKDTNDFLKKKFDEYGNHEKYINQLYINQKEVLPFLEHVVMNTHAYDLNKQRFIADAKTQIYNYNLVRGSTIGLEVFISVWIAIVLINKLMKPATIVEKVEIFLSYALLILVINTGMAWFATMNKHSADDLQGEIQKHLPVEDNFADFDRNEGVALYYALKRGFGEPATSTNRKDIKKYYNIYAPKKTDADGVSMMQFPTVEQVVQLPDWKGLIDSVKHTLTSVFESPVTDPNNAQTITGYKSTYDKIDKQLAFADTIVLVKEIMTQGASLKTFVGNVVQPDAKLTMEDQQKIVTNEIVPLFNLKTSMQETIGLTLKDMTTVKLLEQPFTVSSNVECMLNCSMDPSCLVSSFKTSSKTCSRLGNKLAKGTVVRHSDDDTLYVKGEGENIFLEGGKMKEAMAGLFDTDHDGDCGAQCLVGEKCVKYFKKAGGKCGMTTGNDTIDFDNVEPCTDPNACEYYKGHITDVGKEYDILSMLDKGQEFIVKKLVQIVKQTNYEFSIANNTSTIEDGIKGYVGTTVYETISLKVNTILEKAQSTADKLQKQTGAAPAKYVSKDQFISNMNSKTYADFASMFYSIDTLAIVTTSLNTQVQSNLASNLSAEENIFLAQERNLQQQKTLLICLSIALVLSYILYEVWNFNVGARSSTTRGGADGVPAVKTIVKGASYSIDKFFRFAVPLVCIFFAIVVMVSVYKKNKALYEYNRQVLEKNGGNLVSSVQDLEATVRQISDKISHGGKNFSLDTQLRDMNLSSDELKNLYDNTINTLDLLDKCNLLMDGGNIMMPFPWSDVILNMSLIAVSIGVVIVAVSRIDPVGTFTDLRELNMTAMKVKAGLPVDLGYLKDQEQQDMSITLKVIALIVFIMMTVMFSMRLLESSDNYKQGLYNSKYFANSECVD